jgi:hypothetical protein
MWSPKSPGGRSSTRTWIAVLGVLLSGVLLAACSGTSVIPQAEGTRAVLPDGHPHGTARPGGVAQGTPPSVALLTDHGRHSSGTVVSGGAHAPYNYAPTVLRVGGRYRVWWCSQLPGAPRSGDQILYATSQSQNGPFGMPHAAAARVFTNSPKGFDRLHTCDPSVIEVGGVYYLYYTGTANAAGDDNAIGLATSSDGVHWKRANNGAPIISAAGDVRRSNVYGAGQPSALYRGGWFYLMFTDTSGGAAGPDGAGQFVVRSQDPAFQRGVQALGPDGFAAAAGATGPRTRSVADATTSDWMWVDALNAYAIASDYPGGTTVTFWDAGFTYHPFQPVQIGGAVREGPGLVRTAEGHAPVSTADPCGQVPLDVLRATGGTQGPNGIAHFGVDLDGLDSCQSRSTALALLDGFAVPAPDRTVDLVVGDRLVGVERRSVALALAVGMLADPPSWVAALPVAAHLKPGATAVSAPGRRLGVTLDDGRLWVVGAANVAALNSSPVSTVTDQQWDAYPRGTDLSGLRP